MKIKLIRHGESEANTGKLNPNQVKDAEIPLSHKGTQQSFNTGVLIGDEFLRDALVYCSPYHRTRETLQYLLKGAGIRHSDKKIYEDPRLREIDVGYGNADDQFPLRRLHGWFYYRFDGGESPADCYDRTSAFLESLMRHVKRTKKEKIVIVCHGMILRCFVARFFHLTVEQFEAMHNPVNCEVITIGLKDEIAAPVYINGRWAVEGLRLRSDTSNDGLKSMIMKGRD